MKTIILTRSFILFFAFALVSFGDPFMIKKISDKDFRYEFYTTNKKTTANKNITYYWFKGGTLHETQGGMSGDLLDGEFMRMFHSNQLAEQGKFRKGIKIGIWKTWYPNGILATTQNWHNGVRSGKYICYDQSGNLLETGRFMSDFKTGKWINLEKRDTIAYKKNIIVKQKEIFTKSEKYRIKQENIKLENATKTQKESEATSDAMKLANYKIKAKKEKRIASEKTKTEKATQKASREQVKNESQKDSKVKTFFNTLFKRSQNQQNNG
ncbi:toxin-antitoxin system YwqK family antitoxin [[Flexibacter] sp. ATCC 35103]|uniref:toxin-antitoxin system YwqK family antitoxin n=1 Tax=[Flexibacter] sp. ATCC 35103 TaxID=1937528 RepID=UPI000F4DCA3D|nr:hypothetical protein [[Flexibacter] sp. ATCC 35103]